MSASDQYEQRRRQQVGTARSIMNYVMGIVFCGLGLLFGYIYFTGVTIAGHKSSILDLFLCIVILLYGIWRIYRGYKKNYFTE